jgi:single-stranded-DNA-specific exonuclease
MSIAIAELDAFRATFAAEAARQLGAARPSAAVAVDAEVTLRDLDLGFAEELARLAPFGVANREPLFALSGVTASATRVVGKDHLQLTLAHGGAMGEAIAFGFADADPGPGARVDLAATAELDTFRGLTRVRLKVAKLARAG